MDHKPKGSPKTIKFLEESRTKKFLWSWGQQGGVR